MINISRIFKTFQNIFNQRANERKYLESVSNKFPKFKKIKQKTAAAKDVYGDPIDKKAIKKDSVKDKLKRSILAPTGVKYTRKIDHAHEYLQSRWFALRKMYKEKTGDDIFLTCTWRSPAHQQYLYSLGRTRKSHIGVTKKRPMGKPVTKVDGINKLSQHNYYPSRAIDVCVDIAPGVAKVASWDAEKYKALTAICKKLGLIHGGTWKKFKDWPHIQIPRNMK